MAKGQSENSIMFTTNLRFAIGSFPFGRLFSQGWEPPTEPHGFTLYDTKERLIARATLKNGVHPLTLQTIYPDLDLVAREANADLSDEGCTSAWNTEMSRQHLALGRNGTRLV